MKVQLDDVEAAILDCASQFIGMCNEDGSFLYRYNMDPQVKLVKKYNWLRHSGAIYALADYAGTCPGTPRIPFDKLLDHLRSKAIGPLPGHDQLLAVWARDEKPDPDTFHRAKLGGTALAIVAYLSSEPFQDNQIDLPLLQRLSAFLIHMQKPSGAFYSVYDAKMGDPDDRWTSLYYPGEAALALSMLFGRVRDQALKDAALAALLHLSETRKHQSTVPADHWALLATQSIWPHLPGRDREVLRTHARQVVASMLQEQVFEDTIANGAFTADGRTTPTATRLEGLLAVESLFRDDIRFHAQMDRSIEAGVHFLLSTIIKASPYKGAVSRAIARIITDHPDARKFNRRATEVRIDYIQHVLSALLAYRRYSSSLGTSPR